MSVQAEKTVRTARLELRLSVHERERIEAKAKALGMSLSDYIRMCALGGPGAYEELSVPAAPHLPPARHLSEKTADPIGVTPKPYRCPVCSKRFASPMRCPCSNRMAVRA